MVSFDPKVMVQVTRDSGKDLKETDEGLKWSLKRS